MIEYIKQYKKTLFLKITLVLMFIPIALLSFLLSPQLIVEGIQFGEVNMWFVIPFSILLFLLVFPCTIAIFQTFKLFTNIEKGNYYSEKSLRNFEIIKYCAIVALGLFVAMIPSMFYFMEMDDAPGLGLLALIFVFASGSIAVFASVMRDLVKERVIEQ